MKNVHNFSVIWSNISSSIKVAPKAARIAVPCSCAGKKEKGLK